MKLVQALKAIKAINVQIDDLKHKISQYSADEDDQNPVYGTIEEQKKQVASWLQSIHDLSKEIERLDFCIKKTNLNTMVTIKIGEENITKPIVSWIKRRQSLATVERMSWECLKENTGRQEVRVVKKQEGEVVVKFRRYFDPAERDKKVRIFTSEPSIIDGVLEVTNAETELLEN